MIRIFFLLSLILVSCSHTPTPFCSCMEAGRTLNEAMIKVEKTEINAAVKAEIEKLKKEQLALCEDFQFMDGSKMLELQKECENE
jgi:hypothetical protein